LQFCFPRGVVTSAATQSPSSTFSFVLTEANGARVLCGALLFWEQREQSDENDVATNGIAFSLSASQVFDFCFH
jgi:hypothetical protein